MGNNLFVRLKGRTSYFRKRIPDSLQKNLESTEICVRLGVVNKDSAERQARRLAVVVDAFFVAASNHMYGAAELKSVIDLTMAFWREEDERSKAERELRAHGTSISPVDDAINYSELADALINFRGLGQNAYGSDFVQARVAAAGLAPIDDQVTLHRVGQKLTLALAAHYLGTATALADVHALSRGHQGLPAEEWRQHLSLLMSQLDEGEVSPPQASASGGFSSPTVVDGPLFSAYWSQAVTERIEQREIKAGARHGMQSSMRIMIEVAGDKPLADYRLSDFAKLKNALVQIPEKYWQSPAEQEKPITTIIKLAKKTDEKYLRISNKTINKHLTYIFSIFRWAKLQGVISENHTKIFEELRMPTGKGVTGLKKNEERPIFSESQLLSIFAHPVWTGRKSDYFYNAPGHIIIRDSLYWVPLIAYFSMMRREEICQLKVRDVRKIDGEWCFDLQYFDIDTKNTQSKRVIPIHSALVFLGFLDQLVFDRDPDEQLFVELKPSAVHERYGDEVGNRFERVIAHLKIVVIRKNGTTSYGDLHRLRHDGITQLSNKFVPGDLIDALSGHNGDEDDSNGSRQSRQSERRRYNAGFKITTLKNAIEMLESPFDVIQLRGSASRCKTDSAPIPDMEWPAKANEFTFAGQYE